MKSGKKKSKSEATGTTSPVPTAPLSNQDVEKIEKLKHSGKRWKSESSCFICLACLELGWFFILSLADLYALASLVVGIIFLIFACCLDGIGTSKLASAEQKEKDSNQQ